MKAPDKIYIDIATFGFIHGYNAEAHPPACQEFISKDALMKWINEARAIPHENAIARDLAFQEVVNKLNEM